MQNSKPVEALSLIPVPDNDYSEWVKISMALKAAGGEYEEWIEWCKRGSKFDQEVNRTKWDKFKKEGGITERTLYYIARKYGWKDPESQSSGGFKDIKPDTEDMRLYIDECSRNETEAKKYFCDERGLQPETVSRYRLGIDCNDNAAVIPYPENDYCVRRMLSIDPDGKGQKYENPRGSKRIFNAPAMKQSDRPVFVVEGQIDALSLMDAGGIACTGQNERTAFIEQAKEANVPGFIIIPDNDEAGETYSTNLKQSLKREGIYCLKVSLPPEIHDANDFLRKRGREALQRWITEAERSQTPQRAVTLMELQKKIEAEGEEDPNELVKDRFICKGGAGILAAETGTGKSSIIMQLALYWSAGVSCFGFKPTKPLKILVIQAENDERDILAYLSGICHGALEHGELSQENIDTAMEAVKIVSDANHSGTGFIRELQQLLKQNPETDLVVIDPLFSFAGCDLSNQGDVSKFFRNGIQPLLKENHIAAIFIHHTQKSSRNAIQNTNFNQAYNYYGSAEIANWARFIICLERQEDAEQKTFFKLHVQKRLELKAKYLRWSEDYIYWQELPEQPQSLNYNEKQRREAEENLVKLAKQASDLLQEGQSINATAFRDLIKEKLGIRYNNKIEAVLSKSIELGFVVKREPEPDEKTKPSIRTMIERSPGKN